MMNLKKYCSDKKMREAEVIYGYSKEQQIGKRLIPKMRDRTKITKKEYQKAIEIHGFRCKHCGRIPIEMHHIKYRSQGGKGTHRNLIPLCKQHHIQIHAVSMVSDMARSLQSKLYGDYYWCDKYDLYQMGLIENPDDEEFEAFMKTQERKWEPEVQEQYDFPF